MVFACGVLVVNKFAVLRHPVIYGGEEEKGGGLLLGGESTQCEVKEEKDGCLFFVVIRFLQVQEVIFEINIKVL